jgi:hypothetical protein
MLEQEEFEAMNRRIANMFVRLYTEDTIDPPMPKHNNASMSAFILKFV